MLESFHLVTMLFLNGILVCYPKFSMRRLSTVSYTKLYPPSEKRGGLRKPEAAPCPVLNTPLVLFIGGFKELSSLADITVDAISHNKRKTVNAIKALYLMYATFISANAT